MQIHQLRYFSAVARKRSFTRAAEQEGVTQATLSQQIAKLEKDLGVALFERTGRCVGLTRAGQALLPYATSILRQLADARQSVECSRLDEAGRLTIGCIVSFRQSCNAPPGAFFFGRS
ncbi:MAG: LysR family transcriptional regulator, partial [Acidobacteriota bacterium]